MSKRIQIMPNANYLNIENKDINNNIYRIILFYRLVEIFENKNIVLVKPEKWDDPYENYLLKQRLLYNGNAIRLEARDKCYSQCWSLKSSSDALWRIFSPDNMHVRVKTTIGKLGNAIISASNGNTASSFVGKVDYLSEQKLTVRTKELSEQILSTDGEPLARSLLFKRTAFNHEREVRVIYFDHNGDGKEELYRISIDPHDFIETVQLDPRAPKIMVEVYKRFLRDTFGYKGRVTKSKLYDTPKELWLEISG